MTNPRDLLNQRQITRKAIPVEKAHVHDTAIGANTDFLATDLTITPVGPEPDTVYPPCLFRIMIAIDTAQVFSVEIDDGTSEVALEFNGGVALVAQCVYIFDILVNEGDSINFQCDGAVQIEKFIVQEILWGTQ